jgi:hypothetical protein
MVGAGDDGDETHSSVQGRRRRSRSDSVSCSCMHHAHELSRAVCGRRRQRKKKGRNRSEANCFPRVFRHAHAHARIFNHVPMHDLLLRTTSDRVLLMVSRPALTSDGGRGIKEAKKFRSFFQLVHGRPNNAWAGPGRL